MAGKGVLVTGPEGCGKDRAALAAGQAVKEDPAAYGLDPNTSVHLFNNQMISGDADHARERLVRLLNAFTLSIEEDHRSGLVRGRDLMADFFRRIFSSERPHNAAIKSVKTKGGVGLAIPDMADGKIGRETTLEYDVDKAHQLAIEEERRLLEANDPGAPGSIIKAMRKLNAVLAKHGGFSVLHLYDFHVLDPGGEAAQGFVVELAEAISESEHVCTIFSGARTKSMDMAFAPDKPLGRSLGTSPMYIALMSDNEAKGLVAEVFDGAGLTNVAPEAINQILKLSRNHPATITSLTQAALAEGMANGGGLGVGEVQVAFNNISAQGDRRAREVIKTMAKDGHLDDLAVLQALASQENLKEGGAWHAHPELIVVPDPKSPSMKRRYELSIQRLKASGLIIDSIPGHGSQYPRVANPLMIRELASISVERLREMGFGRQLARGMKNSQKNTLQANISNQPAKYRAFTRLADREERAKDRALYEKNSGPIGPMACR
ncbi:hypothetical protein SAMN02745129_2638 [Ferrimonas marina]|uniref:Uncharacterized protein n=2 Tax=Ferrimonas marina TaxID=299255 RepID=A0A1M5UMJ0_9GAMM|nr:hypothetical protein SAMN02745129_2638 [Ferrimonas marina]